MKLSFNTIQNGNLYPIIYNYLQILPDSILHHTDHDLRHPLAIYNISLGRVIRAFQGILDVNATFYIASCEEDKIDFDAELLLKPQQELLDALMAHIDDGYQILKALHPPVKLNRQPIFANHWLEAAKHPTVKEFGRSISPYRNLLAAVVNKMKHEHGRLRALLMFQESGLIAGYFVEGVDKKGTVGPDLKIHGGDYAFSLHRDLRHHFVYLYIIDNFLAEAIISAIDKTYGIKLLFNPQVISSEDIERVAEGIHNLPFLFFPDEIGKPTPTVSFQKTDHNSQLLIDSTSVAKAKSPLKTHIRISYSGDGVTRSWRCPYAQFR